jgi:hypothetical protein
MSWSTCHLSRGLHHSSPGSKEEKCTNDRIFITTSVVLDNFKQLEQGTSVAIRTMGDKAASVAASTQPPSSPAQRNNQRQNSRNSIAREMEKSVTLVAILAIMPKIDIEINQYQDPSQLQARARSRMCKSGKEG